MRKRFFDRKKVSGFGSEGDERKLREQVRKNNLIGLVALLLFFVLAFDIGGCSTRLGSYLCGGG